MIRKMWSSKVAAIVVLALLVGPGTAAAAPRLFGVNPFSNAVDPTLQNNGLWELDYNTGATLTGKVITLPGFTVTGAQGLALDPMTRVVYAIVKVAGANASRRLVRINLDTAACTDVGSLGDNFSSIAFRNDGQLFGVTGDGASVPETLYRINKVTAAKTLVMSLGAGGDGEVLAFNPIDQNFYHWSGSSPISMERFPAYPPHTITPIFNGNANGEIFGAIWDPGRLAFLVTNIGSSIQTVTTSGSFSTPFGNQVQDTRGLVLLTAVASAPATGTAALVALVLLMLVAGATHLRMRAARKSVRVGA